MIKNYLLLAIKSFRKQKLFSLINILGLTVGITCCLLIFLFIRHETSFDNFHKKELFRVVRRGSLSGSGSKEDIAWVSGPYARALKNDFPDLIKQVVRVQPDNDLVTYNNISFNERKVMLCDSNFFSVFDFVLLKGDPRLVLRDPHSIVLTETAAKKYFGSQDPMGKILQLNKKLPLKVTGIAADVPVNSHLEFDMIIPLANWPVVDSVGNFPNNGLFTYVELNHGSDRAQLEARFPQFMDKYMGKYFKEFGFKLELALEPMRDIYFTTLSFDAVKHGNKKVIYIFMSIAVLILIIACINFMNLATARATERSKEVGLRKVLGAVRRQLIYQFIFESFLYATVSSLLAIGLLQLLLPAYSNLLGYPLPSHWGDPYVWIFVLGVILIIGFLAGLYPALLLSSFSPVESLKGKIRVGTGGAYFRKALVVFQFGVSVLLIFSITIIGMQMNYVRSSDLGFNKEQTLLVKIDNNDIYNNRVRFKKAVLRNSSVISASLMSGEPGGFHDVHSFETQAGAPGTKQMFSTEFADMEFVKTLGLKIIAGRDLSPAYPTDSLQAVLVNRSAAAKMGYTPEEAIGKWVRNSGRDSLRRNIVGVVEDYHYVSLKEKIEPIIISTGIDWRVAVIRLHPSDQLAAKIDEVKAQYADVAPGYPFEYEFLDETFNNHYKDDIKQGIILKIFSGIAIFIACLGLFGLASYTAIKRTKEIGVRKVLGSSIQNIVILLSKDLLKPVLLGTLIAMPVGYYVMNKWLQGFAYRVSLTWWMFVVAAGAAVLIAISTVSYQAVKAALANPVKSLRSE